MGMLIEGYWKFNMLNGHGRTIFPSGGHYIGDYKDDLRHGKGKFVHKNGAVHEGEWRFDHKQGKGEETWPDKSHYSGMYKDSKMHGKG